jgi:hypothetical protein
MACSRAGVRGRRDATTAGRSAAVRQGQTQSEPRRCQATIGAGHRHEGILRGPRARRPAAQTESGGATNLRSRRLQAGGDDAAHHRATFAGHAAPSCSTAHHDADAAAGPNNQHAAADPAAPQHFDLYGAEFDLYLPACEHELVEFVELEQPTFEQQFELLIKLVELQTLTTRLATLTALAPSSSGSPEGDARRLVTCQKNSYSSYAVTRRKSLTACRPRRAR